MPEQPDLPEPSGLASDLRASLERMRKEAEEEIARLNRKLAEREYAAERNVESVTERQATQQELSTLREALSQKEEVLERITGECRRLEDELEDQHVAVDGLKQEVERKDSSLKNARDEVQRLQLQLAEIQEHSVDISQGLSRPQALPSDLQMPSVVADPPPGPTQQFMSFSAGLISGLVLLGIVSLLLWGGVNDTLRDWWYQVPDTVQEETAEPETLDEPLAENLEQITPENESPSLVTPVTQAPRPPRTVRDRLRNGSQGPTLVELPGGVFRRGRNSMSSGDTGPESEVRLAPFLIGAYEVTFQQYDQFVRATGRRFPDDYGWGRGTRPAVGLSWSDAEAYADWLTRQTGKRYRLPSEAEWEFAALAGGRGSYWWGFGMELDRAVCFDCGSQWDNKSTAPVGSFPASPYGMFDIAGNVLEWVSDCYTPGYEGAPLDGRARLDGDCTLRVARGGAFNKPAASMRTYVRHKFVPQTRLNNLGFRVARDP